MKKYAFLAKLEELLAALPQQEREDALRYYEEYLDAAGQEQAQAIAALGAPEEVAQKILEGEGLTAPAAPSAHPAPAAAGPTPPVPLTPGSEPSAPPIPAEPTPPAPGSQPPAPPAPPAPVSEPPAPPAAAGPTPPVPPTPASAAPVPPPPPGGQPPHPAAPTAPAPKAGSATGAAASSVLGTPADLGTDSPGFKDVKLTAIIAVVAMVLVLICLLAAWPLFRAERAAYNATSAPAPVATDPNARQPQSAVTQPSPAAAQPGQSGTAQNQSSVQAIGNDTTYSVYADEGYATVTTTAPELELTVQCGDVTVTSDPDATQLTVTITGAEQGTFDVRREENALKITDLLRRGSTDVTPVTVAVSVPASAVRELDIEVGTGSITLAGDLPAETSAQVGTGTVTAESVTAQELDVGTGSGDIRLGRVVPQGRVMAVDAETGTGDIEVTVVGSEADYKLELEPGFGDLTVNGQARARGEYNRQAANELDASTGTGDIAITFTAP